MLNPKMFDLLKGQFVSNLNQDVLALSGFCSEDEISDIFEKALEMAIKKADQVRDQIKSDAKSFVDDITNDALNGKL